MFPSSLGTDELSDIVDDINSSLHTLSDPTAAVWGQIRSAEQLCSSLVMGGVNQVRSVDHDHFLGTCIRAATNSPSDRVRLMCVRAISMLLKLIPSLSVTSVRLNVVPVLISLLSGSLYVAAAEDVLAALEVLVIEVAGDVVSQGIPSALVRLAESPDNAHLGVVHVLLQRLCARCRHTQWENMKVVAIYLRRLLETGSGHPPDNVYIACRGLSALVHRFGLSNKTLLQPLSSMAIPGIVAHLQRIAKTRPGESFGGHLIIRQLVGALSVFYTASPTVAIGLYCRYGVYEVMAKLLNKVWSVDQDTVVKSFDGLESDVGSNVLTRTEFCQRYLMDFVAYITPQYAECNPIVELEAVIPFHNWSYGEDTNNLTEHSDMMCTRIHEEFLKMMKQQRLGIVHVPIGEGASLALSFEDMKQYGERDSARRLFYDPVPMYFVRRRLTSQKPTCACVGDIEALATVPYQASSGCCGCFGFRQKQTATDPLDVLAPPWSNIRPHGPEGVDGVTKSVPDEHIASMLVLCPSILTLLTSSAHGGIINDCIYFLMNLLYGIRVNTTLSGVNTFKKSHKRLITLIDPLCHNILMMALLSLGDGKRLTQVTQHIMRTVGVGNGETHAPRFSILPCATYTLSGLSLCYCLTAMHMMVLLDRGGVVPCIVRHRGSDVLDQVKQHVVAALEFVEARETKCRLHPSRYELFIRLKSYSALLSNQILEGTGIISSPTTVPRTPVDCFYDFVGRWRDAVSRRVSRKIVLQDLNALIRDHQLAPCDVISADPFVLDNILSLISQLPINATPPDSEIVVLLEFLHSCVAMVAPRCHEHEHHTRHYASATIASHLFLERPMSNSISSALSERLARPFQIRLIPTTWKTFAIEDSLAGDEIYTIQVLPFTTFGCLQNYILTKRADMYDRRYSLTRTIEMLGRSLTQFEVLFQQNCSVDLSHVSQAPVEPLVEFQLDDSASWSQNQTGEGGGATSGPPCAAKISLRMSVFEALLLYHNSTKAYWSEEREIRQTNVKALLSTVLSWWSPQVTIYYTLIPAETPKHVISKSPSLMCPKCAEEYGISRHTDAPTSPDSYLCPAHFFLSTFANDLTRKNAAAILTTDLYANVLRAVPRNTISDNSIFSLIALHDLRLNLLANIIPTLFNFNEHSSERQSVDGLAQYAIWRHPDVFPLALRTAVFDVVCVGAHVPLMRANFIATPGRITLGIDWLAQLSGWGSTHRKLRITVRRSTLLDCAETLFRRYATYPLPLEVIFQGEAGTGVGPTTEFYVAVSIEFQRPELGLWVQESDEIFPSLMPPTMTQAEIEKRLDMYTFFGRFLARALREGRMIDMRFHSLFFELLLNVPMDVTDDYASQRLLELDEGLEQSLRALLKESEVSASNVVDMSIEFTLPGAPSIELIPGGVTVPVTGENVHEFIHLVRKYRLSDGIRPQMKAILSGIDEVFPVSVLRLFSAVELGQLLTGSSDDSVVWTTTESFLKDVHCAHGYTLSSKQILDLAQFVLKMNASGQREFLRFVTGCPRVPRCGLRMKITIVRKDVVDPDHCLPTVNTCFHYLKLPAYTTSQVLETRLGLAISEGQTGFEMS